MTKKRLVVHESDGTLVPDICGKAIEMINHETSGASRLSVAKLIIDSGASSTRHYHKKTEEVYYILSGIGNVSIGGETHDVGKGHAIFLPVDTPHQIVNTGDGDLVFICADSPEFDPDDVFEE